MFAIIKYNIIRIEARGVGRRGDRRAWLQCILLGQLGFCVRMHVLFCWVVLSHTCSLDGLETKVCAPAHGHLPDNPAQNRVITGELWYFVRRHTRYIDIQLYNESMTSNSAPEPPEHRDKSIASYFSDGIVMKFATGQTIINGYDEPGGVFLIKQGFVKACSTSEDGHANLLVIHEAGEFVPLPWSLDGYHVTGLFYEAMSDVTVIRSSKDKLRIAMGNNAWLTNEVLGQAVNIIAIYTQRIQVLEFRSARGRVIAEVLFFAERFGRPHGKGVLIEAPITHQDIADSINMNRETASRALELLSEEGLVVQDDHVFAVPDMAKLKEALS